jgi:hypothetical protein
MADLKTEHCCNNMDYYATTPTEEHELIRYHSEKREYTFMLHGYDFGLQQEMSYCPWCGTKLPESLGEKWCKVVEEECGVKEVFAEEWAKLPEEFRTNQWWKKRGL